jgi:cell division transport system ATP-binding protein
MKIVFNNISKLYGVINTLKNVDFSVESGEFLFIVGPSGAGKTTIIKLILHQIQPTSGEIYIDDVCLSGSNKKILDKYRRQIGVIFQDYQLITDKTIEENIALALDINNFSSFQITEKIDKVIKLVNLNNRRHLFPAQLSGGELQRAALARALAVDPKVLLADEPTGNLDVESSWNLIKLLKDINEKTGTTVIMTTHNLDIINSLGKRIITLKNGEIVSDSLPENTSNTQILKKHHKHLDIK